MTCRRARRSGKATRRGCSALGAQPQPGLRQAMPPTQGANPAAAKAAEAKPKPKKGEAEKLLAAGKVDAAAAAIAGGRLHSKCCPSSSRTLRRRPSPPPRPVLPTPAPLPCVKQPSGGAPASVLPYALTHQRTQHRLRGHQSTICRPTSAWQYAS